MSRVQRLRMLAAFGAIGIGLSLGSFTGRKPLLVWNFTASAPLGLYRMLDRPWIKGDWVAVRPEPRVAAMLTRYGVLEPGRLLIKRVAAVKGDEARMAAGSVPRLKPQGYGVIWGTESTLFGGELGSVGS